VAKLILNDIVTEFASNTAINVNNQTLEAALENTLSRDGTGPNALNANLDMNGNKIINLAPGVLANDLATVAQVEALVEKVASSLWTPSNPRKSPLDMGSNEILNVGPPSSSTSGARLVDISDSDATGAASATLRSDLGASTGSSLVGFLQDGVGAVSYPVEDKLRQTVSVKDFGAVGDGVTDDTASIQAAIDSGAVKIHGEGTFLLSSSVIIKRDNLELSLENIKLTTAIEGIVVGSNNDGTPASNVKANYIKLSIGGDGIAGSKAVNVVLAKNCEFTFTRLEGFEHGIYFTPREGTGFSRSERNSVRMRSIGVDYPIRFQAPTNQATRFKGIGDTNIFESELQAALVNIHAEQTDGLVISDPTLYQTPTILTGRLQNIYLRECAWVNISNAQCFESGSAGIEIEGCTQVNISNANLAWSGELDIASGVYIHDDMVNAIRSTHINLSNINVNRTSKHGIEIVNSDYINLDASAYSCSNPWKNAASAINTYSGLHISGSNYISGKLTSTSSGQHKYDIEAITSVNRVSLIATTAGAATAPMNIDTANVNVIGSQGVSFSKLIECYAGMFIRSGTLALSGSFIPNKAILPAIKTIPDTTTSYDVSEASLLYTANAGATSITNFTGQSLGQELKLVARDANTTLTSAAGGAGQLLLKGGSRLLALNDVVNFTYVGGVSSWVEE
jgi:hypothetical protein